MNEDTKYQYIESIKLIDVKLVFHVIVQNYFHDLSSSVHTAARTVNSLSA